VPGRSATRHPRRPSVVFLVVKGYYLGTPTYTVKAL
jgi:hypothetical protein